MGDVLLMFRCRPDVPGVEDAFWRASEGRSGRCVIAWIGIAGNRWLELADVLICPAQPTKDDAFRRACKALRSFPGSTVAVAECDGHVILVMCKGNAFSFCALARRAAWTIEDYALMCYSRLVSPP